MNFSYNNFGQQPSLIRYKTLKPDNGEDIINEYQKSGGNVPPEAKPLERENETTIDSTSENTDMPDNYRILVDLHNIDFALFASLLQNINIPTTHEPQQDGVPIDNSSGNTELKDVTQAEPHEPKETPKEELAKRISQDFVTEIGFSDDEIKPHPTPYRRGVR